MELVPDTVVARSVLLSVLAEAPGSTQEVPFTRWALETWQEQAQVPKAKPQKAANAAKDERLWAEVVTNLQVRSAALTTRHCECLGNHTSKARDFRLLSAFLAYYRSHSLACAA